MGEAARLYKFSLQAERGPALPPLAASGRLRPPVPEGEGEGEEGGDVGVMTSDAGRRCGRHLGRSGPGRRAGRKRRKEEDEGLLDMWRGDRVIWKERKEKS